MRGLALALTLVLLSSADNGAAGPVAGWWARLHQEVRTPGQAWGSAKDRGQTESGRGRNDHKPQTLRARYPQTQLKQTAQKPAQNAVEVGTAPAAEPEVRGFDLAKSRELPERRDAHTRTFANADGTESTEVSPRPVNFRRPDGTWAPIDTRLVADGPASQRTSASAQGWRNTADAVDVRFAPKTGAGPLVRVGLGGGLEVGYGAQGAVAPGSPAGERGVTYKGVWPQSDLKVEAVPGGVKETIVLKSAKAPRTFVFPLALKGLTAKVAGDHVVFVDQAGRTRASIPAGFMFDSAATPATSTGVSYSLVSAGGVPALRVSVDAAWLEDPARKFPVMVDPTVATDKAGNSVSVGDGGTTDGGQALTIGSRSAAYMTFSPLVERLRYHRIFGAYLWMLNYEAATCRARPVTVHPVTEPWAGNTTYPGPSVGKALTRKSFSQGYIAFGSSTSKCPPKKGQLLDLGKGGRDLIQKWVNDPSQNYGLSVRDASGDSSGYKKFTGHDTVNPPRLYVTHSPYNASYAITNPIPNPPVTQAQAGKIKMTVTNTGSEAWAPGAYYLAYRAYDNKGKLITQQRSANLTTTVARGAKVRLDAEIKPLPPGTYKLDFTMVKTGGKVFTDEYVPPIRLIIKIIDIAPVLQELYPFNGYQTPTLTPQLWARAVDLDAPPSSALTYKFEVCEKAADGSAVNCFDSGFVPTHAWTVPAGRLSWSKTYLWRVIVKDTGNEVPSPRVTMQTSVPQPEITSRLAEAQDRGFDPMAGNYTTSAVDAAVATVGPSLSLERTYNSLDPRKDSPFGAGWSTQFDMKITEDDDGSGNVVVGYPDGQQIRFGRNPDGTYASPPGRYATFTLANGVGKLVDKTGTTFEFTNRRLTKISDAAGLALTLTYDTSTGKLSKATGVGGRLLNFTWSGAHVATVSTAPVDGKVLTWNYTYDGDKLTRVCAPGNRCTGYDYSPGSHYRSVVTDSRPESYWRLDEEEGDSASSQIAVNLGKDAGTYKNVTLQAPGVVAGTGNTAATFNGTSSQVVLPNGTVKKSRDMAVEIWFKNNPTGSGGPLLGYQDKALDGTPTVGVPVLFTDTDGRLRGQFYTGAAREPIVSTAPVNDGLWHHAVLSATGSTQTLYLDGSPVGSLTAATPDHRNLTFNQIGAAYATGTWQKWGSTPRRFYNGTIDEVSLYQHPLGPQQVAAHFQAAKTAADQLTTVTLPSGKVASEVVYDTAADRATEVTDANGGTWKLGAPVVYGGDTDLRRAVEVRDPADRYYLYEQDAITGNTIRVGIPMGRETRDEDRPGWSPSPHPTPTPTTTCSSPDPGDPQFCTTLPGAPGEEPDFIGHTADGMGIRTFDYDDRGFPTQIVNEHGDAVQFTYDGRGNLTKRTTCRTKTGPCHSVYYTYPTVTNPADPRNDLPTAYRDGRSSGPTDDRYKTSYTYTTAGHLQTQTNPSGGGSVSYTFTDGTESAVGGGLTPAYLVETMTDQRGSVTRYAYTSAGDLAQVTDPPGKVGETGLVTKYTYDAIGRRKTITEISDTFPAGVTTGYGYDDWSNLTSVTGPATTNAVTGAQQQQRVDSSFDVDGNLTRTQVKDQIAGGDPRVVSFDYDDRNRLEKTTDAYGHETGFGYDVFGNLTTMTDAADNRYEYAYTARNMLAEVRLLDFDGDPDGAPSTGDDLILQTYAYDEAGRLLRETDAMGRQVWYDYYTDDLLKSTTLKGFHNPDGTTRDLVLSAMEYDGAGNPTKETTGNGLNVVQNTYDNVGRLATTAGDPTGINRRATFTYNNAGDVTQVARSGNVSNIPWATSTAAETVTYGYDLAGRTTRQTVTDAVTSLVTTYGYDQRDLLTSVTDPRGNVTGADKAAYTTNYGYDQLGRQTTATSPPVQAEQNGTAPATVRPGTVTGYNAFDEATETKDERGNTTRAEYDLLGQLVKQIAPGYTPPGSTTPLTPTTVTHYDPLGRVSKVVDPRQNETRYSYDRLGRVQTRDEPYTSNDERVQWRYTYTRTGQILSTTDPNGARTEATYDDLDRPVTATQIERRPTPASYTSRYAYDDAGNLRTATSPLGATTTNTYNKLNQPITSQDPANVTVQYGYDRVGRQIRASDGAGRTQKQSYDLLGRLRGLSDLKNDGTELRQRTYNYDPAGNLTEITNPLQRKTTLTYDALNRLTRQIEPVSDTASITTTFGYDAAGNRTRFTDGRNNATTYTVNSLGLPESTIEPSTTAHPDPADRTWTTGYDEAGNATKLTAPGGVARTRTFDPAGRLTHETGTGPSVQSANRTLAYDPVGQLTKANAPSGTNVYSYDDRGGLLKAEGPSGNATWAYNNDGQPTARTDAAGTATFGYNNGRLQTVQDGLTGTTQTLGYNAAGQPQTVDYGSGRVRTFGYDDLGRVKTDDLKSAGNVITSTTYGYNDNDQTTSKSTTGTASPGNDTYDYDHAGRLTAWTHNGTTTGYAWDDAGNRTSANGVTATFDQRNRRLTDGDTTYTYTPRGNLATETKPGNTQTYSFDAFDRLTTSGLISYTYDDLDRLATRGATTFTYNGTSNEPVNDGTTNYARGAANELLATAQGTNKRIPLTDKHGDLTGTFNPDTPLTSLTDSTTYDPFGKPTATTGTKSAIGYQSDWTDPDTGHVNMGARWYNPSTGTFNTRDDWTLSPSPASANANRYAYANANPVDNSDPTGHASCPNGGSSPVSLGGCPGWNNFCYNPQWGFHPCGYEPCYAPAFYAPNGLATVGGCPSGDDLRPGSGSGGRGDSGGRGGGSSGGISPEEQARRDREKKRRKTEAAKNRQERRAQKNPVAPPPSASKPHYPNPRDRFPGGPNKPAPVTNGTKNVVKDTNQQLKDMRQKAVNEAGPITQPISVGSIAQPQPIPGGMAGCNAGTCVSAGDEVPAIRWPGLPGLPNPSADAWQNLADHFQRALNNLWNRFKSLVIFTSIPSIILFIWLKNQGAQEESPTQKMDSKQRSRESHQQLSPAEEKALVDKKEGRPYNQKDYNSAMRKKRHNEKQDGDRNIEKRNRKKK
ncbi:LamG-like jellyroll fold domain-containing protein [Spirillospora sp. NPDC047279]|uniref:LamG-like jellyroll fold domain-containing protein n=1 Tax=Spirillospora sp. NPDC047279 TaxID=3155478 RepID=UPI0033D791DE